MKNGELKQLEVDFVATKENGIVEYYQVSQSVADDEVLKRELNSLQEINDNYPKYLLTLDSGTGIRDGIHHINALTWLLEK